MSFRRLEGWVTERRGTNGMPVARPYRYQGSVPVDVEFPYQCKLCGKRLGKPYCPACKTRRTCRVSQEM